MALNALLRRSSWSLIDLSSLSLMEISSELWKRFAEQLGATLVKRVRTSHTLIGAVLRLCGHGFAISHSQGAVPHRDKLIWGAGQWRGRCPAVAMLTMSLFQRRRSFRQGIAKSSCVVALEAPPLSPEPTVPCKPVDPSRRCSFQNILFFYFCVAVDIS